MTYIHPFSQLNKTNIPSAGGKGANLGEMTAAGFPVPTGFVLTTAAYDAFVQAHGLQQQIVELAQTVSADDPQSGEAAAEKIRALFTQGEIGDALATEVTCAYQELIADSGSAVAVRSSATAEDLPGASFAGQQDTFLNIRSEEALLDAVKKCWASLWTARAIAYRQRQDIDPSTVSLAVVMQELVDADSAGILFTANPTNGERDQILINATWGLGEAIVGGLVTPDSMVVDQSTWQIVSRETATKTVMTVRTDTGTEEQAIPPAQQNQAVLDDAAAVQLAQIGAEIAAHYNAPMDIEWAIADGEVAILQARPITSLPAAPLKNVVWEPTTPNTVWMRRQIVEHMPEPLSPLFEDLYLRQGMEETLDDLLVALGSAVADVRFDLKAMMPHGFADTINGYAYTTTTAKLDAQTITAMLKVYPRILRMLKVPAFDWEGHVLPNYQALIARWDALDLNSAESAALLQGMGELAAADSGYWFGSAAYLGLSRFLDPAFDKLLKTLFRAGLPHANLGSSAFLRGFDSKALDAQANMEQIADTIRNTNSLRELVLNTTANQLQPALAAHPEGQPVLDGIEQYLAAYGHQIYNLDFAAPTQSEDPLPMFLSLKALVKNAPAESVRVRQAKMGRERDALIAQTEQALNPLSRKLFAWVWKWTKHFAPYREHVMFYMGAAWPTVRKLAAELGQRLTDAGVIAAPDDVYFLNSDEIAEAIAAQTTERPVPDLSQVAEQRRALRESRKLLTAQPKVPARSALKIGPIELKMFDPTPDDSVENSGPVLNGYAVSTGRVTAPASVIHSIEDFDQMQPGSILVCTTTTPAWTPLFSQAVGLVTDVGGALAHGSIVAREYGIPAVMGTGVATERIQSGMMLAVNGDAGTVTLVDEVAETTDSRQVDSEEAAVGNRNKARIKAGIALVIGLLAGLIWWRIQKKKSSSKIESDAVSAV